MAVSQLADFETADSHMAEYIIICNEELTTSTFSHQSHKLISSGCIAIILLPFKGVVFKQTIFDLFIIFVCYYRLLIKYFK